MNKEIAQKYLDRLDFVVKASEIKWGICGVQQLCCPETAEKFKVHWERLCGAIMESRYEDVCLLADGAIRGVWKMEAEAFAAGHAPGALPAILAGQVSVSDQNACGPLPEAITVPSVEWFKSGGETIPF